MHTWYATSHRIAHVVGVTGIVVMKTLKTTMIKLLMQNHTRDETLNRVSWPVPSKIPCAKVSAHGKLKLDDIQKRRKNQPLCSNRLRFHSERLLRGKRGHARQHRTMCKEASY